MDIYRNGIVIKKVHPSDSDKVTKKVMGDNTLSLSFDLTTPFIFAIGDYCFFDGEKYTLNILPKVKKNSRNQFEYDMILEGVEYELRKVQHLYYTANLEFTGGSDFSLMGDSALHARVIVENLNRVQSGWTVGNVISTDVKNITFSSNNCKEALNKIVEEFGTEYWIGSDKTINIEKKGDILPITLEYGKNKGLYSIERENVNSKDVITRLYPFGSTSNLIKGYRNNAKRLQISTNYIEKNVDKYGVIESSQIFEDIKPERTGTITAIGSDIFTFVDSSMDFDLNTESGGNTLYLIPGTTAKIHFQTGDLAGYEFELSDYIHSTKTFVINKFTNEVAYDLPNNTLKPRVGDKYIILDIYMPQSYVDNAEARLLAKAQESLNQNSEPNVAYKVVVDPLFIKNLGLIPKRGDYVSILDDQLNIDREIRIVSIVRGVNNSFEIDIDLADTIEPSLTSKIETTLENQDIVLKINKLNDPARARRNFKVSQELQNAIFDQEGYFNSDNIKPLSIETNMLSVGSKGNRFYIDGLFEPNYLSGENNFKYSGGSLAHFAMDGINVWAVTGIQETIADNNLRYIYAFCDKDAATGYIVISTDKLNIDGGNNWQFLVGVLSSVFDSARNFTPTFGNTTANGRFLTTGRISSADGLTYFDLDTNEIVGKINFKDGLISSMIALASGNNVTAGLQGDENINVAAWFGGTYQNALDALAKIIFNKDGSGQLAGGKISFNQFGGLNVGDFKIQGGAIDGYADNKVKVRFKIGDLPSLASLIEGQIVQDPTEYAPDYGFALENNDNPGPINEPIEVITYGELIVPANTTVYFTHPDFNITLSGGSIQSQTSYFKIKLGTTVIGTYGTSIPSVVLTAGGTYTIEHHVEATITIPRNSFINVDITTNTAGYLNYNIGIGRTEIGKNGFYSYWETSLYLYFSLLEGLKYKGAMDIPGVLASASVASGGTSSRQWGAKVGTSTKASTGTYTINHSIGHSNFAVHITPQTASRVGYVSARTNTTVTIVITNLSGTATDTAFDYCLTGNN